MKNVVLENKIEIVKKTSNFLEIFGAFFEKHNLIHNFEATAVNKRARVSKDGDNWFDIDIDYQVSTALVVVPGLKHIQFICETIIPEAEETLPTTSRNAADVLMNRERRILQPVGEANNKDRLHNKLLAAIQHDSEGKILITGFSMKDGHDTLRLLSNVIWYLDGRSNIIIKASKHRNLPKIPDRYV